MEKKYLNYRHGYLPSKFAEDYLMVSDTFGNIYSPSFHYERLTFNNNVVIFVTAGTLYVEQYGEKIVLRKNQGILMHLNDAHKYFTDKADVANILFFHFRGNVAFPIITQLKEFHLLPVIFHSTKVEDMIYHCFDIAMDHSPTFEYELSAAMIEIVIEIVKHHFLIIQKEKETLENSWFADKIVKYVEDNIYNKITLDEMADYANMSRYHFCRIFSQYFNMSPIKYVTRKKIDKSKRLLQTTHLKLSEIAYELGFSDQSFFSRTFKSLEGISPLNYRKLVEHSYLSDGKSQK